MIEYIRYSIPTDQGTAFQAAYRAAGDALEHSSHHRGHEVSRCIEEPERWVVRIEWDSTEGHLKGFRGSPEFADFFAHIRPYVSMIEEMQHYEVLTAPA